MKLYVGVTDNNWYQYLAEQQPDEVNFWQPGGKQKFGVLEPNGLFLFKLHSPQNYIAGGGFFIRHAFLPVSLAWDAFGNKNGTKNYASFLQAIYRYRKTDRLLEPDPIIGCTILTSPFFFTPTDWIPIPEDWSSNIVSGKSYDTSSLTGRRLFKQVEERLQRVLPSTEPSEGASDPPGKYRYGSGYIAYPRIGQGAFKVLVTEAYQHRCAISGEKTLPVLEAAHIKPYSLEGPHQTSNGLLLRKDLHTLFDRGYITVDEKMTIEVSKRIKEDYGNGREYYAYHGKSLIEIPNNSLERPSPEFLRWHNENIFLS